MPRKNDHTDICSLEMMLFGGVVELPEPMDRGDVYGSVEARYTGRPVVPPEAASTRSGEVLGVIVQAVEGGDELEVAPPDYLEKHAKGEWDFKNATAEE